VSRPPWLGVGVQAPGGHRAIGIGVVLGAIGLLLFGIGILLQPRQAYFSYLTAYVTGVSLMLGALLMVMISHLTGAAWFAPLRRTAEAIAATGPILAVLFLPLIAGLHLLYPWVPPLTGLAESTRESIQAKQSYLNQPFFLVRAGVYFAVWSAVGLLLRRWSIRRGPERSDRDDRLQRALSAGALPAVALTLTFAVFDWVMSLSPEWYSAIYGVYLFAGGFLAALALLAATAPAAQRARLLGQVPIDTYHSLGKLLLTFVVFWLYIGFSQLLIIWIANVPAEVAWYLPRLRGSWALAAAFLLAGNFLIPFLLLLFRRVKRAPGVLAGIGVWLLAMHYLDVYWLVMPEIDAGGVRLHWLDLATLFGVFGTALAYGAWQLRRHALAGGREQAVPPAPQLGAVP
jgi:hypothetical protein